ncbi:ABC transporter ATP-binding protein [Streptomyces sp. H10-C2]|uniref:ABC transporter ATP-binding protein n=1 Tax=unclassified Streptomyces TaxID=2593676 RepID=UPI0024BB240C|nr:MULTISPECIES: ABC transporter ATP-binding protein [unclassified Streptomyces]MDJ0344748.1 ABC transporter ATP-binding protein [Streptomyces sp. PH10-H1]MDJ0371239.1 ABC transporter ATP-binding protein [Streptomyces sp. H10-C2]
MDHGEAAIELTALTKRYGRTVGVDQLDITVQRGEVFGFLGPNGAGKTTAIRCLIGLLRPTSGRVRVLGLDPVADHRRLAPQLGYLPGELRLYPELTGAQTLRLLSDLQGAPTPRRGELCDRLGLSSADLVRPVSQYSRGMKQKLGLVQALQHDPKLVVLDEPTEGLDPLVQETFFTLLEEATAAGVTVLLSSHILPEAQRACGRVAIVRAGRLVTVRSVTALREARARRVRLVLADGSAARGLGAADRWSPAWQGNTVRLFIPPDELVAALRELLATLPVADLTVEEAGLDEAFLDLYRTPEPSRGPGPGPKAEATP